MTNGHCLSLRADWQELAAYDELSGLTLQKLLRTGQSLMQKTFGNASFLLRPETATHPFHTTDPLWSPKVIVTYAKCNALLIPSPSATGHHQLSRTPSSMNAPSCTLPSGNQVQACFPRRPTALAMPWCPPAEILHLTRAQARWLAVQSPLRPSSCSSSHPLAESHLPLLQAWLLAHHWQPQRWVHWLM